MELVQLSKILRNATENHWAVGHFNISNVEALRAIMDAAKEMETPIMIGVSEGERAFLGLKQVVALIRAFRDEYGIPVFLNADHSRSVESAKAAFDAGFDSVHIDLSKLPYRENLRGTREVVDYIKSKSPTVSVEGELGYLRGESRIQKESIEIRPEDLTKPDEAEEFVLKSGIDRFAGAYGNIHGIAANRPVLDISRIAEIRKVLPKNVSLVLHGGSGISDSQMRQAIEAGIANVHVNTELRVAYTESLRKSLADNLEEVVPYKIFPPVVEAMKKKVEEKLKVFNNK
jgi:fructose-bisphosphate aldolase class II